MPLLNETGRKDGIKHTKIFIYLTTVFYGVRSPGRPQKT
jgi:hypothetical protein